MPHCFYFSSLLSEFKLHWGQLCLPSPPPPRINKVLLCTCFHIINTTSNPHLKTIGLIIPESETVIIVVYTKFREFLCQSNYLEGHCFLLLSLISVGINFGLFLFEVLRLCLYFKINKEEERMKTRKEKMLMACILLYYACLIRCN